MNPTSEQKKPYLVVSGGPYTNYEPTEYDSEGNPVRNKVVRYSVGDTIHLSDREYAAWGASGPERFKPLAPSPESSSSVTPSSTYRSSVSRPYASSITTSDADSSSVRRYSYLRDNRYREDQD